MKSLSNIKNCWILGATTCSPTNIHESLRRPGRFTHEIFIQVPNMQERIEILEALDPNIDTENCLEIAQITQGYVGSDLAAFLCHISKSNVSLSFDEKLKQALRLTAPSGFKSGIGTVQLSPLSWNQIGGLQDVKEKLQSAVILTILFCNFSCMFLDPNNFFQFEF